MVFTHDSSYKYEELLNRPIGPIKTINENGFNSYNFNYNNYINLYKWEDYFEKEGFIDEVGEQIICEPYNKLLDEIEQFNMTYGWNFREMHRIATGETIRQEDAFQLDVYPKSMYWKKGTYPYIVSLVQYIQGMHTRPNSLKSITDRITKGSYQIDRLKTRFMKLDKLRVEAKSSGFNSSDLEAVKDKWEEFVKLPLIDAPDDTIKYETYVYEPEHYVNHRDLKMVVHIVMKKEHFNMQCFSGEDHKIAEVPFTGDLEILVEIPLLKRFADYFHNRNGSRGSGRYMRYHGRYDVNSMYRFPWLNGEGKRSVSTYYSKPELWHINEGWGSVCWGDINDDCVSAIHSLDKRSINMMLGVWSNRYSTTYSRPYNKFYTMHCGLTNEDNKFEDDYCSLVGYNSDTARENMLAGPSFSHNSGAPVFLFYDEINKYMDCPVIKNSVIGEKMQMVEHLYQQIPEYDYWIEQLLGNEAVDLRDNRNRWTSGDAAIELYKRRVAYSQCLACVDEETGQVGKGWLVEWFGKRLEDSGWYGTQEDNEERQRSEMAAWVAANSSRNISEESFREVVHETQEEIEQRTIINTDRL